VCQSVARLTPNQSTLPSASTLVSHDTSGYSAWRYLTSEWIRGRPKRRPKVESSAGPSCCLRNTNTGFSAKARSIQAKVASSSGCDKSMPSASVPNASPRGRSCGEPVIGDPPIWRAALDSRARQPGFGAHYGPQVSTGAIGTSARPGSIAGASLKSPLNVTVLVALFGAGNHQLFTIVPLACGCVARDRG